MSKHMKKHVKRTPFEPQPAMFFTFHTPAGNHVQTANVKLGVESMVKSLEVLTKEEDDNDDGPKKKDDDGDDDIGHRHDSCDDFHTSQEALLEKTLSTTSVGIIR